MLSSGSAFSLVDLEHRTRGVNVDQFSNELCKSAGFSTLFEYFFFKADLTIKYWVDDRMEIEEPCTLRNIFKILLE